MSSIVPPLDIIPKLPAKGVSLIIKEIDKQKKEFDTISMKIKKDELKYQEINNLALAELKLTLPGLQNAVSVRN